MPVTLRHLSPVYPDKNESKNNIIDTNGLYGVIDGIIEQAHTTLEISENTKLGDLRKRLGYFAYTDTKLSLMGDAIDAWKNYRNRNNISLPLSLEDELTLIFYIFIYHEDSEIKVENIRNILTALRVNTVPNSLSQLCEQKPLERRLRSEKGTF